MNFVLTHLPHFALSILTVWVFVWMERSDRQARAAGIDGEMGGAEESGPSGGTILGLVIGIGAWLGSIDIAVTKARTARYFDLPTEALGELSQPGGPLYGIEVSNGGLITFPGGLPLQSADGTVIGAIGVSGSTVENDHAVAEAGVAALESGMVSGLPGLPAFFDEKSGGAVS